jgi:hypothetical protein
VLGLRGQVFNPHIAPAAAHYSNAPHILCRLRAFVFAFRLLSA